jgi:hypothetical protein
VYDLEDWWWAKLFTGSVKNDVLCRCVVVEAPDGNNLSVRDIVFSLPTKKSGEKIKISLSLHKQQEMKSRIRSSTMMKQAWDSSRILGFFVVVGAVAALSSCQGFVRKYRRKIMQRPLQNQLAVHHILSPSTFLCSSSNHLAAVSREPEEPILFQPATSEGLIEEMTRLYNNGQIEAAMNLLENFQADDDGTASSDASIAEVLQCFQIFLEKLILENSYFVRTNLWATNMLQTFINRGTENSAWLPTSQLLHLVIQSLIVASPSVEGASVQCKSLIEKQWSVYHKELKRQQESENGVYDKELQLLIPHRDTYFAAIRACSLRDRGVEAAKRAEALMDEMEALREKCPNLTPDRAIMNEVM